MSARAPRIRRGHGRVWCVVLLVLAAGIRAAVAAPPPPALEQLDADAGPVAGAQILDVVAGSQAQALGVVPGDVVVAFNGEPVWDHVHLGSLLDSGVARRLTLADAGGGRRDVSPGPGRLGIRNLGLPPRLTLSVRRAMARDARWDAPLIAAAWALEHDRTADAERALEAARDAGYPDDDVYRGLAFGVAVAGGDLRRAGELQATLPPRSEHPAALVLPGPRELYRFYLAAGRSDDLVRLVEAAPHPFDLAARSDWPRHAALLRDAEAPPAAPVPLDAEAAGAARLVNPMLYGAARWPWGQDLHTHDDLIVQKRPFIIEQRPGSYKQAFLTRNDRFGDFDLNARFTVALNGRPSRRYPSTLHVSVSDYTRPEPEVNAHFDGVTALLGASFQAESDGSFFRKLLHGLPDPQRVDGAFFDGTTEHTLHLSRRGGWGRIVLDGVTVLQRPVDPDPRPLVFHVHLVGLTAEFSAFEITEPRPAR